LGYGLQPGSTQQHEQLALQHGFEPRIGIGECTSGAFDADVVGEPANRLLHRLDRHAASSQCIGHDSRRGVERQGSTQIDQRPSK
jgi:hypothetical protein